MNIKQLSKKLTHLEWRLILLLMYYQVALILKTEWYIALSGLITMSIIWSIIDKISKVK